MAPTLLLACASVWVVRQAVVSPPQSILARGTGSHVEVFRRSQVQGPDQAEPVQAAGDLYNAGRYTEAAAAAERVVEQSRCSADPMVRKQGAKARWVLAFSAARRRDLALSRERFALLRREAAALPDHGKPDPKPGEHAPTLEEEGAYQHAVLTAALGGGRPTGDGRPVWRGDLAEPRGKPAPCPVDGRRSAVSPGTRRDDASALGPAAAEREFLAFIRQYPESPLVHAAVQRIARLHGGEIPKETERAWQEAMRTAREREKQRARDAALCGPEVLVEVLRRCSEGSGFRVQGSGSDLRSPGVLPTVAEAARELGTDERGTSLEALAVALRKRGIPSKGLALTWNGLRAMSNVKCQMSNGPAGGAGSRGREGANLAGPGASHPHPLIALIRPGHYVLVEATGPGWVRVWDPDLHGQGRAGVRQYYQNEWERIWKGTALVLAAES